MKARKKKRRAITQEELFKYVTYREDGYLVWKKRDSADRFTKTFNTLYAGEVVGSLAHKGRYLETCVGQYKELVHRLVFLYHKGYLPEYIDHVDGDGLNNKIENLREATHSQNMHNAKKSINNNSGASVKGVYRYGKQGKWKVQIMLGGKLYGKAGFDSLEEAEKYASFLRIELHREFARNQ